MEKLRELFREYVNKYSNDTKIDGVERAIIDDGQSFIYGTREYPYLYIISKQFGFIKRLVNNDKIDLDIVREKLGTPCFTWYKKGEIVAVKDVEDYEQVLMLLSISDTPIEDLVLYLK